MQRSACLVKLVVMLKHSSSPVEFKEISIMSRVLLQSVPIVALQLSKDVFKLPRSSALVLVLLPEQVRFDASPPPTKVMLSLMPLKSILLVNLPSMILSCFSILFFLLRKLLTWSFHTFIAETASDTHSRVTGGGGESVAPCRHPGHLGQFFLFKFFPFFPFLPLPFLLRFLFFLCLLFFLLPDRFPPFSFLSTPLASREFAPET